MCVGDKAVICHKVGLKDFFFIGKGVGKDYMKYFGKIAKKHVDFLLCHERDLFVEKVYKDAKNRSTYSNCNLLFHQNVWTHLLFCLLHEIFVNLGGIIRKHVEV